MAGMSSHGGSHGGHGFNEGDGGDSGQRLPPGFPPQRLARSPYQGFQYPPMFDAGRGHNLPLVEDKFRIGLFTLLEESYDYLVCEGYEPSEKRRYQEVYIAKPFLLRRQPFDKRMVKLRDMTVYYEYQPQVGLRKAYGVPADNGSVSALFNKEGEHTSDYAAIDKGEDDEDEIVEWQRITEDYVVGDTIAAIRARIQSADHTGIANSGGAAIGWVDLNFSGRAWAVTDEEVEE